ncbi:MAG TPA: cupin domain-containing protein, partial [Blastocatellia bacterium]|nr:cupin domain-containing protein [Blastocatellia bacterium]
MDALTEVLNSVRVRSTVYCPVEIGAPWGLNIAKEIGAPFFILVKGSAFLVIEELNISRRLKAGDFIIITKQCACKVSDSPRSEVIDLQEWLRLNPPGPDGKYKVEGRGEITNFIGGTFFFENHESHPLLKVL